MGEAVVCEHSPPLCSIRMQDRFATLPAVVIENAWRAYNYDSSAAESALLEAFGNPENHAVAKGTRLR